MVSDSDMKNSGVPDRAAMAIPSAAQAVGGVRTLDRFGGPTRPPRDSNIRDGHEGKKGALTIVRYFAPAARRACRAFPAVTGPELAYREAGRLRRTRKATRQWLVCSIALASSFSVFQFSRAVRRRPR